MSLPAHEGPRAQDTALTPRQRSDRPIAHVVTEQDVGAVTAHPSAQGIADAPTAREEERRLNVKFTPEAYAQLQAMAKRRGKTVSETVREALGFDLWLEEQLRQGYSLQLRRKGGSTMTVAMPHR